MILVKLSTKGQMVIPKAIREKLGLKPNRPVGLEWAGDHAVLKAVPDARKNLKGSLKGKPSMSRALVKDHALEVKQDGKVSA